MSDANALKLLEAGALVGALVLFVWWQLRDLKKAAAATARRREQELQDQQDQQAKNAAQDTNESQP